MAAYVPIPYSEFAGFVEPMGGVPVALKHVWEYVWDIPIITRSGVKYPYNIRVLSSVDRNTKITRDKGKDAIRLMLFDVEQQKNLLSTTKRIYRTMNALVNMRSQARLMFVDVINPENHCPKCGCHMVERTSSHDGHKFRGCVGFPIRCTATKWVDE